MRIYKFSLISSLSITTRTMVVDVPSHCMQLTTRNISMRNMIEVEENIRYDPHPQNPSGWTICRHHTRIFINPLSSALASNRKTRVYDWKDNILLEMIELVTWVYIGYNGRINPNVIQSDEDTCYIYLWLQFNGFDVSLVVLGFHTGLNHVDLGLCLDRPPRVQVWRMNIETRT